jgi:uncharacterized protein YndB with AHSA1/START domain
LSQDIRIDCFYDHPPERVWEALTRPDAVAAWLMKGDFEATPGRRFRLEMPATPGFRGWVEGEILEVESPRRLAYSWIGGDDWSHPTRVEWLLSPAEDGTDLKFSHTGFEVPWGPLASAMLHEGWGKRLNDYLPQILHEIERGSEDFGLLDFET